MFKPADDSNIINLIRYVDSYQKLICLLKKFLSFFNWIKTIENNKEKIMKILIPQKLYLKLEDCNCQPEENKFNEILDNINKINQFSEQNNYEILKLPLNFYENFLANCGNNLNNLNKLKNIFKKVNNLPKNITEEIEEKEHNIYDRIIRDGKLINVEMLENLRKDPYYQKPYNNTKFDKYKNINFILNHISFEKLKMKGQQEIDKFTDLFNKLNFNTILSTQLKKELNEGLLQKIKKFDDFIFVYIFTDFLLKDWNLLNKVHEKFINLLKDCKGNSKNLEPYTLKYINANLEIGYLNEILNVLDELNKTVNYKICRNIMIKIMELISKNNEKNKDNRILNQIKNTILQFFEKDLSGANLETIQILFEKITDKNSLKIFLEKFSPLIIDEKDFYYENETEKFKILKHIINFQIFNNRKFKEIDYIKKTKIICDKIINDLKSFNISYDYCMIIYKLKNAFKERIIQISFQEDGEEIYDNIINQVEKYIKSKDNLKKIIMFLISFNKTSSDRTAIVNLNKDLRKIKLFDYQTKVKEINYYENLYINLVDKFYKFHDSNFFMAILKQSEEDDIKKKLNSTEKAFKTLNNLLNGEFSKIDNNLLNIIFKTINHRDFLKKEIQFLKNYFNVEKDTEKIESTIMILSSPDRMKKSLNGIKLLFNELNIKKSNFSNKLNQILQELNNNNIDVENLTKFVDYLKNVKIDVIGEKSYMVILNELTNKKELIPFIKDKDQEGIRNLAEFVGEDDNSSLKASDIQDFIKCVEFIQNLKQFSNLPDEEFFSKFIELSKNNKYKNLEAYIQNINQNFYEIKELYTKNIDKSEFTKQKVRDINAKSIFKITFDGTEYNCSVTIINQEKQNKIISYEEVLEVRDRALLKKKMKMIKKIFMNFLKNFLI